MRKNKEIRNYPTVIFKDADSDYSVVFPNFPGCVTAGDTIEEAFEMAKEALEFHIEGMMEDNEEIPEPSFMIDVKSNIEYDDAYEFIFVPVQLSTQSVRVDITIKKHILNKTDTICRNSHLTRSKYIERLIASDIGKKHKALVYEKSLT